MDKYNTINLHGTLLVTARA